MREKAGRGRETKPERCQAGCLNANVRGRKHTHFHGASLPMETRKLHHDKAGRADRPTETDACPRLTFPSVLSWKLSTRAASVHLAATSRAAFRRRSCSSGDGADLTGGSLCQHRAFPKPQPPPFPPHVTIIARYGTKSAPSRFSFPRLIMNSRKPSAETAALLQVEDDHMLKTVIKTENIHLCSRKVGGPCSETHKDGRRKPPATHLVGSDNKVSSKRL